MVQKRFFQYLQAGVCMSAVVLAGCNNDSSSSSTSSSGSSTITIPFKAMVNGQSFVCGNTYKPVGIAITDSYKINDFRIYLTNFQLMAHDGSRVSLNLQQDGKWQYHQTALVDFESGCVNGTKDMNTNVIGELPSGVTTDDVHGLCFTVGLPFEENHSDPATIPSPLNATGMLWSWTTGRKFIRVDGVGDPDGLKTSFHLHLGSTGCSDVNKQGKQPDAPCTYQNTPEICLSNFIPSHSTVVADIGKVLRNSNVAYNTPDTAAGCMSGNNDPECQSIFPLLGLDFIYNDGANPSITFPKQEQEFFSLQ